VGGWKTSKGSSTQPPEGENTAEAGKQRANRATRAEYGREELDRQGIGSVPSHTINDGPVAERVRALGLGHCVLCGRVQEYHNSEYSLVLDTANRLVLIHVGVLNSQYPSLLGLVARVVIWSKDQRIRSPIR